MTKKVITEVGAFYQHYPRIAIVVGAGFGGKEDAMTIAWHMPMSKAPPMIAFVTSTEHYTYKLIKQSGEFAVNLLPDSMAELVAAIGGSKGADGDKFSAYNIKKEESVKTSAPIFEDAYAAFECKMIEEKVYDGHSMVIGEVVATHIQENVLRENDILNLEKVNPVLYMGSEQYQNVSGCKTRTLKRDVYAKELKM